MQTNWTSSCKASKTERCTRNWIHVLARILTYIFRKNKLMAECTARWIFSVVILQTMDLVEIIQCKWYTIQVFTTLFTIETGRVKALSSCMQYLPKQCWTLRPGYNYIVILCCLFVSVYACCLKLLLLTCINLLQVNPKVRLSYM